MIYSKPLSPDFFLDNEDRYATARTLSWRYVYNRMIINKSIDHTVFTAAWDSAGVLAGRLNCVIDLLMDIDNKL